MGRHRPQDREHKGNSVSRISMDKRRIIFKSMEPLCKYMGEGLRAARRKNGVGRPPLNALEREFAKNRAAMEQQIVLEL